MSGLSATNRVPSSPNMFKRRQTFLQSNNNNKQQLVVVLYTYIYPHWTDLLSKYLETNQNSSKWENFSNNICTDVKPYSLDTEVLNNKSQRLAFLFFVFE